MRKHRLRTTQWRYYLLWLAKSSRVAKASKITRKMNSKTTRMTVKVSKVANRVTTAKCGKNPHCPQLIQEKLRFM